MEHINADFGEQWFTYPGIYRRMAENCRPNGILVELGAWKGRSSAFLIVEAKNKSPDIQVHIVDTWGGNPCDGSQDETAGVYEKFISNMSPLNGLFHAHKMKTIEATDLFEDKSLDAVFIDADHSYEAVKLDIINWMPKIRKGGILAGHDYTRSWPGVIKAVDEIMPDAKKTDFCWIKQC